MSVLTVLFPLPVANNLSLVLEYFYLFTFFVNPQFRQDTDSPFMKDTILGFCCRTNDLPITEKITF